MNVESPIPAAAEDRLPTRESQDRVLLVDDDPYLLDCLRRVHGRNFEIVTAEGGHAACRVIEHDGPFAVIVSDRQMPHMDGVALLEHVRKASPDTVRIMLTGQADIESAAQAVNRGEVFRFLTKPCARQEFEDSLMAAVRQYRLVRAERDLLEQTVRGAVQVLVDVLSLTAPVAFARCKRVHRYVARVGRRMQLQNSWQYETAALLSQIGYVALPRATVEKIEKSEALTPAEADMVRMHPLLARDVIAGIPRLEKVAEILAMSCGEPESISFPISSDVRIGARLLGTTMEFDHLVSSGLSSRDALAHLDANPRDFDRDVVAILSEVIADFDRPNVYEGWIEHAEDGWFLADDLCSLVGDLVARRGQEITPHLRARVDHHITLGDLPERVTVRVVHDFES